MVVDEAAPLYHIGTEQVYAPMLFIVSGNDMPCRYEQLVLTVATLKHFGNENCRLKVMHGVHCQHDSEKDEKGDSVFGKLVYEFIKEQTE